MITLKINMVTRLLFTDTGSVMYEIKTEDFYEDFSHNKEIFDFGNYSNKSKCYDNSNKLVVGKMTDETAGVAIEEFVGLKRKMYSYLVDDKSEHKKAKGVNRNIIATISRNEYKDVLLNKKFFRHSMNRTQSKGHKKGIYKINKISLSCFEDKIYIQSNECDGLANYHS